MYLLLHCLPRFVNAIEVFVVTLFAEVCVFWRKTDCKQPLVNCILMGQIDS